MTFKTAAGGMRNKGAQKPPLTMCPGAHCALLTAGMGVAAAGISTISSVAKVATGFIISGSSRTHRRSIPRTAAFAVSDKEEVEPARFCKQVRLAQ